MELFQYVAIPINQLVNINLVLGKVSFDGRVKVAIAGVFRRKVGDESVKRLQGLSSSR